MKQSLMLLAMGAMLTGCATTIQIPEFPDLSKMPQLPQIPQVTIMTDSTMQERTMSVPSAYDFNTTKKKLKQAFIAKGMMIFTEIDHQQAAKNAGLTMQPATVIIFGAPKAGTPLMVKDPTFALQLPLKVLVTEIDGKTQVVMNRTSSVIEGSQIQMADVEQSLAKVEQLIQATVK